MKKLMVMLLVVCLVLPITAIADVSMPDLTEYSTEDLIDFIVYNDKPVLPTR